MEIMEFGLKWVHMARYELILRLDGALWIRIISKRLVPLQRAVKDQYLPTKERAKEKGKEKNELISKHKIIKKINRKLSIFCSPGHFIGFNNLNKKKETKLKNFLFKHQIKKKFQCSLEWEKNQLAIWDNRSMLHQATPFRLSLIHI